MSPFVRNLFVFTLPLVAADSLPPGIWHSEAYGTILEITKGRARVFDVWPGSYLLQVETRPERLPLPEGRATADGWVYGTYRLTWLPQLPPECIPANQRVRSPVRNFAVLDATFQRHYAFFDQWGQDWSEQREREGGPDGRLVSGRLRVADQSAGRACSSQRWQARMQTTGEGTGQ
jgi:hypothetical protein